MPPSKKLCNVCIAAGLPDCVHCLCESCAWCNDTTLKPEGVCAQRREKGGSRFCRSCRRNRSRARLTGPPDSNESAAAAAMAACALPTGAAAAAAARGGGSLAEFGVSNPCVGVPQPLQLLKLSLAASVAAAKSAPSGGASAPAAAAAAAPMRMVGHPAAAHAQHAAPPERLLLERRIATLSAHRQKLMSLVTSLQADPSAVVTAPPAAPTAVPIRDDNDAADAAAMLGRLSETLPPAPPASTGGAPVGAAPVGSAATAAVPTGSDSAAPSAAAAGGGGDDEQRRVVGETVRALHAGIENLTQDIARCQTALCELDAVLAHTLTKKRELADLEHACSEVTRKVGRLVVTPNDASGAAPPAVAPPAVAPAQIAPPRIAEVAPPPPPEPSASAPAFPLLAAMLRG